MELSFYKNKKILITGHTGFKGAWMCQLLSMLKADVTGYALKPPTQPNLFELAHLKEKICSIEGDVRDLEHLRSVFQQVQPEIVIHMAAQPLVLESYRNPVLTYETNVMGTVNLMECIRHSESVKSVLNVTTDKVYQNKEVNRGYQEEDVLNGFDPYSNSKSCSELVTACYVNSFFKCDGENRKKNIVCKNPAVSTARTGNVIGGGDFAADRIIPDCVRAAEKGEKIIVRNPYSVRPYQHVLEPLFVYLMILNKQYEDKTIAGSYNIGPEKEDCKTTGELADLFCRRWNEACQQAEKHNHAKGQNVEWVNLHEGGPHEAGLLKLDCTKIRNTFGWKPHWNIDTAMEKTVEWTMEYLDDVWRHKERQKIDMSACMERQIKEFMGVK